MEHERFGELIQETDAYFNDTNVEGITVKNEMAQFGASLMRKFAQETENPHHVHAAADGLGGCTVDAQKVQLEDLAALSDSILKDVKAKVEQEKSAPALAEKRPPASAVSVARIAEIIEEARSQSHMTREEQIDYSADRIVDEISDKTGLKGTSLKRNRCSHLCFGMLVKKQTKPGNNENGGCGFIPQPPNLFGYLLQRND